MRRMTDSAPFGFDRRVFISKGTLFVGVTLNARSISAGRQSGLLELKTTVRVVTIIAAHCAFQDLMMKRCRKRRLNFSVTTHAELRIAQLEHSDRRETWFFQICRAYQHIRARQVLDGSGCQVYRMTIS